MDEEEKKARYRDIVYRVRVISNQVANLSNSTSSTNGTIKNSFSIDNKGIEEDAMNEINNQLQEVINSLNNTVIPSLNNKIYS